jgi:hypothetical protein
MNALLTALTSLLLPLKALPTSNSFSFGYCCSSYYPIPTLLLPLNALKMAKLLIYVYLCSTYDLIYSAASPGWLYNDHSPHLMAIAAHPTDFAASPECLNND